MNNGQTFSGVPQIKIEIKIATERCGCDGSNQLDPLGINLFYFRTSLPCSLGLVALTALASWFTAVLLLTPSDDRR